MDWSFIGVHVPDYIGGAWVTLRFGLYGVACSMVLGLLRSEEHTSNSSHGAKSRSPSYA